MEGAFVYFRCWPGFTNAFPFEQFNHLPDAKIGPALDNFARNWLRENKGRVREIRKKNRRRFFEAMKWKRGCTIIRPGAPRKRQAVKVDWRRQASGCAPRDAPFVFRVGIYAGWVGAWARVFSNRSTGPLTWFFHHPSHEFAEQLVAELNQQRKLDYTVHAVAHELQPRFGLIDVAGISTPHGASIKRAINAIKTGGPPLVVYSDYASAVATRAMKVAEELAEAWVESDEELPEARAVSQRGADWPESEPPSASKFKFGPIEGTLKQLESWTEMDRRTLRDNNTMASWWIMKVHRTKYSAWFSSQARYDQTDQARQAETTSNDIK